MRISTLFCAFALALLSSCAGNAPGHIANSQPGGPTQPGSAAFGLPWPATGGISAIGSRGASLTAYEVDLLAYTACSGLVEVNDFGMDFIQLTPPAPGSCAWVAYSGEMPALERLSELFIDVDDANLDDEEWVPELPWWVGFANFATGTWEWHGEYMDFMASPSTNDELAREAYLDGDGYAHWVILSYCAPDMEPATMSLWMMDIATEDVPLE